MANLTYEDIIKKICEEKGVSKEQVEIKIKEKLNQLSDLISKEGAAHIVANEFGVRVYQISSGSANEQKSTIKDLNPIIKNVEVTVKVQQVYEVRSFKTAMREGRVVNLFVGDETGNCRLVLWDEKHIKAIENKEINVGDVLKVKSGYVKENNRGYMEVHLGSQGSWVINPEGVKVEAVAGGQAQADRKNIKDLAEGETATVIGTVVQIFEPRFYDSCPECGRKVMVQGEGFACTTHGVVESKPQGILNIVFDDGTDNIRIVCFRENINAVLDVPEVVELKDNPDKFRELQRKVAGKQLSIVGRVNRNTFFDRLEMVANSVSNADPKQLAMELKE
jgi:ssDNA-binding replication factor A large subunit